MLRFIPLAITLALAGCHAGSHSSAAGKTNWYQAGYEDALSGAVAKDRATLAANYHDVKPDRRRYLEGYTRGQATICQPEALHAWGIKGKLFPASCDGVTDATLLREAWQRGMDQGARDALLKDSLHGG